MIKSLLIFATIFLSWKSIHGDSVVLEFFEAPSPKFIHELEQLYNITYKEDMKSDSILYHFSYFDKTDISRIPKNLVKRVFFQQPKNRVTRFRYRKRVKRFHPYPGFYHNMIDFFKLSSFKFMLTLFQDPLWSLQWYLLNFDPKTDTLSEINMNFLPTTLMFNVTGRGVRVAVIDSGIELNHPDLRNNADFINSYDVVDNDRDPSPESTGSIWLPKEHGTRCAGQIVMKPNNRHCGVGVAYGAKIIGIRLLVGPLFDYKEAIALSHRNQIVDIYSSSWGPQDDGQTIEGPGELTQRAFENSITFGRNGRGNIYVWASGNGGQIGDSCAFDGYVSQPYSIAVTSVADDFSAPPFNEPCAAVMTSALCGWRNDSFTVVTTDLNGKCTVDHGGTSASASFVAGAIALALEMEPRLTWRDVQHLIIQSSESKGIGKSSEWQINGVGRKFSPYFGFGLLNVFKLVSGAEQWYRVSNYGLGKRITCKYNLLPKRYPYGFSLTKKASITIKITGCGEMIKNLEHVSLVSSLYSINRGSVEMDLVSPRGTKVKMMYTRWNDQSSEPINKWPFNAVHFWGEPASGTWKLLIKDRSGEGFTKLRKSELILTGTYRKPHQIIVNK